MPYRRLMPVVVVVVVVVALVIVVIVVVASVPFVALGSGGYTTNTDNLIKVARCSSGGGRLVVVVVVVVATVSCCCLGSGETTTNTDSLIEVARCKLMTLHTSEDYSSPSSQDYTSSSTHHSRLSSSQPGSPPRTELLMGADKLRQHRKYSEGSRLKACLQGLRTGWRCLRSCFHLFLF